jgi:hypothetical protein
LSRHDRDIRWDNEVRVPVNLSNLPRALSAMAVGAASGVPPIGL